MRNNKPFQMIKAIKSLLVFLTLCSFVSCTKKTVEANVDVVLCSQYQTQSPEKVSGPLREIYSPLTETGCDSNFLLTGKIIRVDVTPFLDKKIKRNDDLLSKLQKQITKQTDKMIQDEISRCLDEVSLKDFCSRPTQTANQLQGIESVLSQNKYSNTLVYSSDPGITYTIWNTFRLFTKISELRDTITGILRAQPTAKIAIIYNPPISNAHTVILSATDETTSTIINTTTTIIETQITAVSLEDYFNKLSDRNIPYNRKAGLRSGIVSFFTSSNADVIKMNNNEETSDETVVGDYVEALCNTHKKVTIIKQEFSGKKISKIYISES